MSTELNDMLFKLMLQGITKKKIEEDLGFSNGSLGKKLTPVRFELFKRYYNVNVIDDRDNPLINAARGRDANGINNNELPENENKPQIDKKEVAKAIVSEPIEVLGIPNEIEIVDYQKLFNECEFPDEYKALWERIKNDQNITKKDKELWKGRLNAK